MKIKNIQTQAARCQAVIFDMDGVLVDSEPIHADSFRVFMNEINIPVTESFIDSLVGYSIDHNIQTINQVYLSKNPLKISEGVRKRDALYLKMLKKVELVPQPGVEELMTVCLERGIKMALASSSVREQVDLILANLSANGRHTIDFNAVFDVTVSGDEVANKKPAPDIYRRALDLLGKQAGHCMTIEDSEAGILSAKANGVFCFALRNQYLKDEHARKADHVIDSIGEVAGIMKLYAGKNSE